MARRKKHEEEHADERWLITYADVLTLMFVLFMVLFSISVVNTSKFEMLKQTLQTAFSSGITDGGESVLNEMAKTAGLDVPAGSMIAPVVPTAGGVDAATETARALENRQLEAAKRAIDATVERAGLKTSVTTRIDQRGLWVRLATDGVLFDSGSAALRQDGADLLDPISITLKRLPNPVRVEGHTDSNPISTATYASNWELSGGRAAAVVRRLASNGMPGGRLELSGFGDTRPISTNDTAAGRAANRRVVVLVQRVQGGEAVTP
jgi:chemotaxis protein MotB